MVGVRAIVVSLGVCGAPAALREELSVMSNAGSIVVLKYRVTIRLLLTKERCISLEASGIPLYVNR
jgi:hypothetical protein